MPRSAGWIAINDQQQLVPEKLMEHVLSLNKIKMLTLCKHTEMGNSVSIDSDEFTDMLFRHTISDLAGRGFSFLVSEYNPKASVWIGGIGVPPYSKR